MDLRTLSRDELAAALKPTYQQFYKQLGKDQQAKVTFDQVVSGAYDLLRGKSTSGSAGVVSWAPAALATPGSSACVIALGMVIADTFAIVFQFAGINEEESRAAARAILREAGEETIRGIAETIHDFSATASTTEKAKLMWRVLSQTYNAVGVAGLIKALKHSMQWYDWVITGTTVVAQLVAWFGTDGVALIAEMALETAYVAQFTEDVVKANATCA